MVGWMGGWVMEHGSLSRFQSRSTKEPSSTKEDLEESNVIGVPDVFQNILQKEKRQQKRSFRWMVGWLGLGTWLSFQVPVQVQDLSRIACSRPPRMAFHEPFHWSAISVCSTLFWLAKKLATTKELGESNVIGVPDVFQNIPQKEQRQQKRSFKWMAESWNMIVFPGSSPGRGFVQDRVFQATPNGVP